MIVKNSLRLIVTPSGSGFVLVCALGDVNVVTWWLGIGEVWERGTGTDPMVGLLALRARVPEWRRAATVGLLRGRPCFVR